MLNYWEIKIRDDNFRLKLRIGFNILLAIIFVLWFVLDEEYSKLSDPIRFFTSDFFEYVLITVYCQLIYSKFRNKSFKTIALYVLIMLLSLLVIAYFKNLRLLDIQIELISELPFELSSDESDFWLGVLNSMLEYIGYASFIYFTLYAIDHMHVLFDDDYNKTREALKKAELQLLKQRLNPHFLYNAFNSLYSLSLKNHAKTPDTILKLSSMMRYITDESIQEKVSLKRELKFISEYIAIEQLRFGKNANIIFEVDGNAKNKLIEPLLLITLVENAFKHGFYTNHQEAYVQINATINDDELIFETKNKIIGDQLFNDFKRKGKGLILLQKRLHLVYPKKAILKTNANNVIYKALLKIPLN